MTKRKQTRTRTRTTDTIEDVRRALAVDASAPTTQPSFNGAKRSEVMPAYDQIPGTGIRRIAKRFSLGETKYGRDNWKKALTDRATARAFANDAFNHLQEHLLVMGERAEALLAGRLTEEQVKDDHLGAAGWAVVVLAYIEQVYDCDWNRL